MATLNYSPEVQQALSAITNTETNSSALPYSNEVQQALDAINGGKGSANWKSFSGAAKKIASQRGFPPNVLLAQAANESARGKAAPGNNFFGIKGQGTAGSNNLPTQEFGPSGYYSQNSSFAGYNSPEDAINAYINLVTSYPGVKQAIASGNPDAVIRAIKAGGYATSPTYVQDVENTPEFRGQ